MKSTSQSFTDQLKKKVYLEKYHEWDCEEFIPSLTTDKNGELCLSGADDKVLVPLPKLWI